MNVIKTIALVVIAACYVANTVGIYKRDDGSTSFFFGNIGYYTEVDF